MARAERLRLRMAREGLLCSGFFADIPEGKTTKCPGGAFLFLNHSDQRRQFSGFSVKSDLFELKVLENLIYCG